MGGEANNRKRKRNRTMHGTNEAEVIVTRLNRAVRLIVATPNGVNEAHMAGRELDRLIARLITHRDFLKK